MEEANEEDETRFLNVDLDIESPEDVKPLLDALEPVALALDHDFREGMHRTTLELLQQPANANEGVRDFCAALAALPPIARGVWDRASRRVLDVGFGTGVRPHSVKQTLDREAVRAAAHVGAEIMITVYSFVPPRLDEGPP